MKKYFLLKKCLVVGFILIFVSLNVVPTITAQSNDDITICITAGFFPKPNYDKPNMRSIGRGLMMYVVNNWTEPIWVIYQFDYYTLSGEPLKSMRVVGEFVYSLPPNNSSWEGVSNFIPLPCQITMSVEVGSFETGGFKTVTRSGYQFHRWVFFPKEI